KTDAIINKFKSALQSMDVPSRDVYVDFVAQNRIYGYDIAGDIAKEKLTGFEVKKNIAVHYSDTAMLDRLVATAANAKIFDLVKGARKARTFYFNPLNAKVFDSVINPVVIEPVVQFTLYLKMRYPTRATVATTAKQAVGKKVVRHRMGRRR